MSLKKKLLSCLFLLCSTLGFSQQYTINISGTSTTTGTLAGSAYPVMALQTTEYHLIYVVTGSPSVFSVQIEGSSDNGVTYNLCGSASTTLQATQISCNGIYDHVRGNATSLSGGTSPVIIWTLSSSLLFTANVNVLGTPTVNLGSGAAVSVNNFPSSQNVLVSNFPTGFNVTNFPSGFNINNIPHVVVDSIPNSSGTVADPCQDVGTLKAGAFKQIAASSTTEIISLTGGQTIFPCGFLFNQVLGGTFKFVTGTGTNCAAGQTDVSGTFGTLANQPYTYVPAMTALTIPVGQALCGVTTGLTAPAQVQVTYAKK